MALVNACVSTHDEQTNTVGKDLSWKDKYWEKNFKKLSLGALPLTATPAGEGNAGAAAGIDACINTMNFSPHS